ncbi:putative CDP-glycerol:poly(Glycerophosphate) glycerophosphotransferase [Cupriavidus taiwanensis]|uniref:CDP-glycerol glycerophosphotransferase family protein n=1 Tax=Cupriavidus taiwanensis TaxID=164546 RepID=UPI000E1AF570|nr:CDP-glycerol glycerophosphotransferase family protein [Cupriavidus taiwanensis]SOY83428.1 putative CDP-glycerol:poly(Glycerophosphate) glycerophosphotransferase [Cupriavidus taiwanensis]SOY84881.1 putative CDP-glycerol:poly(Glycerophosphate) glycerophosphotransferase [Cupriavidus taiwanensis]
MGYKTISWAKNVPKRMKWIGILRHFTFGYLLRLVFVVLEATCRHRKKNVLLFVLPYEEYDENTRYLYEYAVKHRNTDLEPVLFVYHEALYARLRGRVAGRVVAARSKDGMSAFFASRIAFTSRGAMVNAFYPYVFVAPYKRFINLWHGIPLKRIGFLARNSWESLMRAEAQRYSAMTVCSAPEQFTMALSNNMSLDDIWITNTPRNDLLFHTRSAEVETARPGVILYAPTYRDGQADTVLFPFADTDIDALAELLRAHDFRLVVRRHVLEKHAASQIVSDVISYDDRDDVQGGLAGKLCAADILVTDYSSIYLDYLALDRPIVFLPYDKQAYEVKRGLMYDYDAVTPGIKAHTFAEFLTALRTYMTDPRTDATARRDASRFFHAQQDGNACQRVLTRAIEAYAGVRHAGQPIATAGAQHDTY